MTRMRACPAWGAAGDGDAATTCGPAGQFGTADDDWVSMAIPADGSYGIEAGIVYSYPVRCAGGRYEIVQDLDIDDFSRARMDATEGELREERAAIETLL